MDLLAPILAYLGTVAAMIAAVAVSYDVFVYIPLHPTTTPQALTLAAKPSASKEAGKATASIARDALSAAHHVRRDVAAAATAAPANAATTLRAARLRADRKRRLSMRGIPRQGREREWASEQSPQAFGYAGEPRAV